MVSVTDLNARASSPDEAPVDFWCRMRRVLGYFLMASGLLIAGMQQANSQTVIFDTPRQLTTDPFSQFLPAISDDLVVYTDLRNVNADIFAYDLATGLETQISNSLAAQTLPEVSGRIIVYQDSGSGRIVAYDFDTGIAIPLSASGTQTNPAIDGNMIAYQSGGDIFVVDLSGKIPQTTQITNTPAPEGRPSISGKRVVYERFSATGSFDIYVYDLEFGVESPVATTAVDERSPHIDGPRVVWDAGVVGGDNNIHLMNVKTQATAQLLLSGDQRQPRISGQFVAFEDDSTGDRDIVLWRLRDAVPGVPNLIRLRGTGVSDSLPDIDGNRVVFNSDRSGNDDIWIVDFGGEPPVADAGPNQSVAVNDLVILDGSGSFDDITPSENLAYLWNFSSVPVGSTAINLTGAFTDSPRFTADVDGIYVVNLVVTDELGFDSVPDTMIVSTVNTPPNADAGADQAVVVGTIVTLDGSGSSDPDGNALTYAWRLTSRPANSLAFLPDPAAVSPIFFADETGSYEFELLVNDGFVDSSPDSVTIIAATGETVAEIFTLESLEVMTHLPADAVVNSGNQQALIQALLKVIKSLDKNDIVTASRKLELAIERTDGCAERGSVDQGTGANAPKKDYITTCAAQSLIYPLLVKALAALP